MKLGVERLSASYGASRVLFDIAFEISAGETVALIGRNGAGKTSTLHAVMGVLPTRTGSIRVGDEDTVGLPPHRIARLGLGLVPETRRVFGDLTVEENLEAGVKPGPGPMNWSVEDAFERFPPLQKVRHSKGSWLSGGEQQILAIARTLLGNPAIVLLDEPTEGLAPRIVDVLADHLQAVREAGVGILLAEQNLHFVSEVAQRAYVLDKGVVHYEGSPQSLLDNEEVRRAHLAV